MSSDLPLSSVGGRRSGKTKTLTQNVIDYLREQSNEAKPATLDANSQLLLLGYIEMLERVANSFPGKAE